MNLTVPQPPFNPVLFDLDGTIADTAPGILRKLRHTIAAVGYEVPDDEALRAMIGPPLLHTFRETFGMPSELAERAMQIQRNYVADVGAADGTELFEGVLGLIEALHAQGVPMAVATSRNQFQAEEILAHFDLSQYFYLIAGHSEEEGRTSKADSVAACLRAYPGLTDQALNPVLIGDRVHDLEGAHAQGIAMIWSGWGYGTAEEVAGSDILAPTVAEAAEALGVAL